MSEIDIKIGTCGERMVLTTYADGSSTVELLEEDDTYCQRVRVSKSVMERLNVSKSVMKRLKEFAGPTDE